jgi:hypothetical protein
MPNTPLSDRDLELLSAYLDGELRPSEKGALEARLARDETLRAVLDDLQANRLLLRQAPRLKAPRSFTLDPAVFGQRYPWWRRALFGNLLQISGTLAAAAAIALIMIGLVLNMRQQAVPAGTPPVALEAASRPTQVTPLPTTTPLATAALFPQGTPTPFPTVALPAASAAEEAAQAVPAPMLAQPEQPLPSPLPEMFPADMFSAEEGAGEAGAFGMAAPPGEMQMRDASAATAVPATIAGGPQPTFFATATPETAAEKIAASMPSPSPVTPEPESVARQQVPPPEDRSLAHWLLIGGGAMLAASGALFAAGWWRSRRP